MPELTLQARDWQHFDRADRIAAWDALAQWASEPNPFFESWYLLPSLRALDNNHEVVMLALEADGQLAGILPLMRESSYYGYRLPHWRNWVHANCFLGVPLVARGFERLFWRELLAWADRNAGFALFLHLAHLPACGPLHEALAAELRETGRPGAMVLREERAMLASENSAEVYLEKSLSTKKRKELRRQHRRLSEEGDLTVERQYGTHDLESWTADFVRLERRGWKGKKGSALACDMRTMQIFAQALRGAAGRGKLDRIALRLDGKPIAMLANFVCEPGAFSYKTAFDEDYARFSPGVLLQRENLALLEREEVKWVDSCAAKDHPMIDHLWRERRIIARHSIGIGGMLRRAAFTAIARRETGAPALEIAA